MPELPEVETIRRDLSQRIISKKITTLTIRQSGTIRGTVTKFRQSLLNQKIEKLDRVGKLLIGQLSNGLFLLIHLKMTGQLIYRYGEKMISGGHPWPELKNDLPNKFTRVVVGFADGSSLFFNDLRRFGYWRVVDKSGLAAIKSEFGREPIAIDYTWSEFQKLFRGRKVALKAFLLNQKLIAGLGNIYADEACFLAGVRPQRRVNKLTLAEKKKIWQATKKILLAGIKNRGTTFSDYVDASGHSGRHHSFLKVYGRHGELCKSCQRTRIKKIRLAGRGTHYCPTCQK